jgi:hypothetical protein
MKAFETGVITKKEFVRELKKHQRADNFLRGTYWNGSKGCAVGCSIESINRTKDLGITDFNAHREYPRLLGIPEWLARVEDTFFENMSPKRSKKWPVQFAEAIHEGADLEQAKHPFFVMVLEHALATIDKQKRVDAKSNPTLAKAVADCRASVVAVRDLHKKRVAAESAAWSAAESAAWSAAESAAWSAAESAAESAAWSAAESAAWSAAESAAWSAAWSAARSAAWSAARSAARSAAFDYYADRLLELLRECKPGKGKT